MKTEREKMLAGELYAPADPALVEERLRCRRLLRAYNQSEPTAARFEMLEQLLGAVGERTEIEPSFSCDYGKNIRIGARFFANFNCVFLDPAEITIGDDVMMGPAVQLYTATHPVIAEERIRGYELARPIRIESRVWLGGGVIVLPGVSIGEGTVVGAGSVVGKDLPPRVVAVGNPCRIVRTVSGRQ